MYLRWRTRLDYTHDGLTVRGILDLTGTPKYLTQSQVLSYTTVQYLYPFCGYA